MIAKFLVFCLFLAQTIGTELISKSTLRDNKDDDVANLLAQLNITSTSEFKLKISYRNYECYKCRPITVLDTFSKDTVVKKVDTFYPYYYIFVQNAVTNEIYCQNLLNNPFQFGEKGSYLLMISNESTHLKCNLISLKEVDLLYEPIYIATGVFVGAALIYIIGKYVYKNVYLKRYSNASIVNSDLGVPLQFNASTYLIEEPSLNSTTTLDQTRREKIRMKSVDVFRGFSLAVVIFANYGAGGYSSLDHAVWNGLNFADTVFPCFVFILGISIPLSFRSIAKKAAKTDETKFKKVTNLLFKIVKRTILLFFFGLLTSNNNYYLKEIRIMGVLQRFALSYLVCALVELLYLSINNFSYYESISTQSSAFQSVKNNLKEIFFYPIQWLIMFLFALVWLLITLFLEYDFCAPGYMGPGGLHENSTYFNCTGGAAGYIDRLIFGISHVYQHPTSQGIYQHILPHDPEGLLGTLNSICLAYFGVQCGHIIIHYQEPYKRIIHFISYSFLYGIIGAVLCKFSKDDGWIPINKNLWSLSFILVMACIAYFILTVFYILVDLFNIYSGTPFLYFGRNSITIYLCHIIFQDWFPFFNVPNTHDYLLGRDLYGICLWFVVAGIMNHKKIYINL